jgi:GPH family glycoside/pentoside/hexuronide:cation symporter
MENRLKFRQRVAYGSGDFAANILFTFVSSFLLIYLTDSVGLNIAIVGTLLMVSKIFDGVTDVFFGRLIDHTKSKMGKTRPWVFWSTIPLGVSLFLMFAVPNTSISVQYIYVFIVYTCMNAIFFTANNIAYASMVAFITDNKIERVVLGSYRGVLGLLASLIISFISIGLVQSFGGGTTGWAITASIYGIILIILNLWCVLSVKEMPKLTNSSKVLIADGIERVESKVPFFKNLSYLFKNKYFLIILFSYIVHFTVMTLTNSMAIYYVTHVLKNQNLFGVLQMSWLFPMIISIIVFPKIMEKFGVWKSMQVGNIISIIGAVIILFSRDSLPLLFVGLIVRAIGFGPMCSINALIVETANYAKIKFNIEQTGTVFSCSTMGVKIGSGIASALGGFLLAAGGYDGLLPVQPESALLAITNIYHIAPLIGTVLIFSLNYFLNVKEVNEKLKKEHDQSVIHKGDE